MANQDKAQTNLAQTPVGQVYNNSNQYSQKQGSLQVGEVMGIAGLVTYNNQSLSYAQYIQNITQNIFLNNSYNDDYIKRKLNTTEVANTGTRQYLLPPALLPVSNFAETDVGNTSFATATSQYGMLQLYLQVNFFSNNMINLTGGDFKAGIQERLLGSLQKSIPVVKNYLSLLEETLFCLATGQFFFTDLLGKSIQTNSNNMNNKFINNGTFVWTNQQPLMLSSNSVENVGGKEQLKLEFNSLSAVMGRYPLSIKNMWSLAFNIEDIIFYGSYNMRTNLSQVMNWGAPFSTNEKMVEQKSFKRNNFSSWYNISMSDYTTLPQLQNGVGLVSQEIQPSQNGAGSPLGYGFNNVVDMTYLDNVVGFATHKDGVETYITLYRDFNPYSTSTKNFYRLGGEFGWGQVHPLNYSMCDFALIQSSAYINVLSKTTQISTTQTDQDWNITSTSTAGNGDPITTSTSTLNGLTTTITAQFLMNQLLTDIQQAQTTLKQWQPGMKYDIYNFIALPVGINDPMPGASIVIGDSTTPMTFKEWAQYNSLVGLQQMANLNGKYKQLIEWFEFGINKGTYQPYQYELSYPQNLPPLS